MFLCPREAADKDTEERRAEVQEVLRRQETKSKGGGGQFSFSQSAGKVVWMGAGGRPGTGDKMIHPKPFLDQLGISGFVFLGGYSECSSGVRETR